MLTFLAQKVENQDMLGQLTGFYIYIKFERVFSDTYFLCVDFGLILQPNSALFEACCNERIQQFNDSNSDEEDMWEEKELTYTSTAESRPRYILYTSKKENTAPVRQCVLRYLHSHRKQLCKMLTFTHMK